MTDGILDKMEERRNYKNKKPTKYHELQSKKRTKINETKEFWVSEKCYEFEEYEK